MTGKGILEALSFVDEPYIEEAETGKMPASLPWLRLLPLAACLCLVLLALYRIPQHTENSEAVFNEAVQETLAELQDDVWEIEQEHLPELAERVSIILRLDSWEGAYQFKATVIQFVESDAFPQGTELTVILQADPAREEANIEMDKTYSVISLNPGDLLYAELYHYDADTATIWVEDLRLYQEEEP